MGTALTYAPIHAGQASLVKTISMPPTGMRSSRAYYGSISHPIAAFIAASVRAKT
jgi:hypothetical protein